MDPFEHGSHDSRRRVINQHLDVVNGFLVVQVQPELVLHFPDRFVRFQSDVWYASVHHQREQVQDKVRVTPE